MIQVVDSEDSKSINRNKIAEYASYASWNLNNWDKFQEYVCQIDEKDAYEKQFFQSVINIEKNKLKDAEK